MNKQTFKTLRRQFRSLSRKAYSLSLDSGSFSENLRALEKEFRKENPTEFFFNWFEKPSLRNQVVSMKIFAHLDYPFENLKEQKWN